MTALSNIFTCPVAAKNLAGTVDCFVSYPQEEVPLQETGA